MSKKIEETPERIRDCLRAMEGVTSPVVAVTKAKTALAVALTRFRMAGQEEMVQLLYDALYSLGERE
jgi:hypothetical protein